ncbi:Hypothetical protein conserved in the Yarrowia clade [Yarrowia lipolytica]|nr:Hypothetical protein conserved in the Yarrowia clade [Yarrowia lipolytica]
MRLLPPRKPPSPPRRMTTLLSSPSDCLETSGSILWMPPSTLAPRSTSPFPMTSRSPLPSAVFPRTSGDLLWPSLQSADDRSLLMRRRSRLPSKRRRRRSTPLALSNQGRLDCINIE